MPRDFSASLVSSLYDLQAIDGLFLVFDSVQCVAAERASVVACTGSEEK